MALWASMFFVYSVYCEWVNHTEKCDQKIIAW